MVEDEALVSIVTVSFNTIELTSLLIWSLHRVLDGPRFDLLVVENGSGDGSAALLADVADAGLCRVIFNDRNMHHGPALNQAMASLADQSSPPRFVWVLDSDVVISRGDALQAALAVASGRDAAIVGERHWDQWKQKDRFELYSLMIDLAQVWRSGAPSFQDDGDPSFELLESCQRAGQIAVDFPFAAEGFLIHRGRASLAGVFASDDRSHPLYESSVRAPRASLRWRSRSASSTRISQRASVTTSANSPARELVVACQGLR